MKSMKTITILGCAVLMGTVSYGQFGKLKEKVGGGGGSSKSESGGAFEYLNAETDELGMTGQYFSLYDKKANGFKFVKESGGKIVNSLLYFEKKGDDPKLTLTLKEKYYTKNQVKMFYVWINPSANMYVELLEIAPGVLAQIGGDRSQNDDNPIPLDAKRTVKDVIVKDKASFTAWDMETAQAQVDMIIASLNTEAMEKEGAKWMENKFYAANVGKVMFAINDYDLMKRGYANKLPEVSGESVQTVLDMNGNMNYMAFFKNPPKMQYPGQEINIVYEMNGVKTSRTELRGKSAAWGDMVKRLETKDFDYRQHAPRALREYNSYHSQYVQDYAFMYALYQNKDQFMIGEKYDVTVKIYVSRDGVDGDLLAQGTIKLLYSPEAHASYTKQSGVWSTFHDFLDE